MTDEVEDTSPETLIRQRRARIRNEVTRMLGSNLRIYRRDIRGANQIDGVFLPENQLDTIYVNLHDDNARLKITIEIQETI